MTDKERILAEIDKLKRCTMDEHMKFYCESAEAEYNILSQVELFINSLQEKPVSEDLEEAAIEYCGGNKGSNDEWKDVFYVQLEGSDILYKERYLEFQHDTLSTELKTNEQIANEAHWQDVREHAAIAAMQGIMNFFGSLDYNKETIAKLAVEQADELVKQLKEK